MSRLIRDILAAGMVGALSVTTTLAGADVPVPKPNPRRVAELPPPPPPTCRARIDRVTIRFGQEVRMLADTEAAAVVGYLEANGVAVPDHEWIVVRPMISPSDTHALVFVQRRCIVGGVLMRTGQFEALMGRVSL